MITRATTQRLVAGFLVAGLIGCASGRPRRSAVAVEPPLATDGPPPMVGSSEVVQAPETRTATMTDRHPLFTRPREWYDTTNGNKFTRTAAAAFIGVPSGIGAEIRQIVQGQPPVR